MGAVSTSTEVGATRGRLAQEVLRLLGQATERLRQHFAICAAEFDLSAGQGKLLLEVQPEETVPMRSLADRLRYDASNLTSLVDRLEARGALVRCPHPEDRRVKGLALTAEGRRLRQDLWERLLRDGGPVGGLTAAQLESLRDLLHAALTREEGAG